MGQDWQQPFGTGDLRLLREWPSDNQQQGAELNQQHQHQQTLQPSKPADLDDHGAAAAAEGR